MKNDPLNQHESLNTASSFLNSNSLNIIPLNPSRQIEGTHRTLCTRMYVSEKQHALLLKTGEAFAKARHTLFKRWKIKGEELAFLKKSICQEFGLSSKQFNGIRFEIDQAVATWSGTLDYRIESLKDRIDSQEGSILSTQNKIENIQKDLNRLKGFRLDLKIRGQEKFTYEKINQKIINPNQNNPEKPLVFSLNTLRFKLNQTDLSGLSFSKSLNPKTNNLEIQTHHQAILVIEKLKNKQSYFESKIEFSIKKLDSLKKELALLEKEKAIGIPRVCFGGKNALRKANQQLSQFMMENPQIDWTNLKDFQDQDNSQNNTQPSTQTNANAQANANIQTILEAKSLLEIWKTKRTSRFCLVGSKDETGGNQSAIYNADTDTISLSLPKIFINNTCVEIDRIGGLPHITLKLGENAFQKRNRSLNNSNNSNDSSKNPRGKSKENSISGRDQLRNLMEKQKIIQTPKPKDPSKEIKPYTRFISNSALTWSFFYEPEYNKISSSSNSQASSNQSPSRINSNPSNTSTKTSIKYAWGVRVSFAEPPKSVLSHFELGCIGLDLNVDHIAGTRLDRFGNLVEVKTFPFPSSKGLICESKPSYIFNQNQGSNQGIKDKDKNTENDDGNKNKNELESQNKPKYKKITRYQSEALIEQVCIEICTWARSCGSNTQSDNMYSLPIVIEDLDFSKKKVNLKQFGPEFARLLSNFAYSKFKEALLSRAFKEGIEVKQVNPAYTSQIAEKKYKPLFPSKQFTIHVLASYVIGRRGMNVWAQEFENNSKSNSSSCVDLKPSTKSTQTNSNQISNTDSNKVSSNKQNIKNSSTKSFTERFPKHIQAKDLAKSKRRKYVSRWKNVEVNSNVVESIHEKIGVKPKIRVLSKNHNSHEKSTLSRGEERSVIQSKNSKIVTELSFP